MARNTTGHSGEKFVEAMLGFQGFTALVAPAGNPNWDIMVAESGKKISVKASNSSGFVAEFSPSDTFDILAVVDAYNSVYPRVWFIPRYVAVKLHHLGGKVRINPSDLTGDLAQFETNFDVL